MRNDNINVRKRMVSALFYDLAVLCNNMMCKSKSEETYNKVERICKFISDLACFWSVSEEIYIQAIKNANHIVELRFTNTDNAFGVVRGTAVEKVCVFGNKESIPYVRECRWVYKLMLKECGIDGHNKTVMIEKFNRDVERCREM